MNEVFVVDALRTPFGSFRGRLVATLLNGLRDAGGRYGLAYLCIGGGEAVAAIFENLD